MTNFSLFEGDLVHCFFRRIGLRSGGLWGLITKSAFMVLVSWVPMAILALLEGTAFGLTPRESFFFDVAAYGQFIIGLPLYIFAQDKIDSKTRHANHHLRHGNIIPQEHLEELNQLDQKVIRACHSPTSDLSCLTLAFLFTSLWIVPELRNGVSTWHAPQDYLSYAGMWDCMVAVPLLNYWWLRWGWKIIVWCWYLRRVSQFKLRIVASHPDMVGGLEFISEAQTSFGAVIFAFGCGVVAASVAYKLTIEEASLASFATWGPIVGFVILAPVCFLAPLFMFTDQLKRCKREAKFQYDIKAAECARTFEAEWFGIAHTLDPEILHTSKISTMADLKTAYDNVNRMRVVPFDVRSLSELFASTGAPLIPIIFHIFHQEVPEWLKLLIQWVHPAS